jgi:hypothetical protein
MTKEIISFVVEVLILVIIDVKGQKNVLLIIFILEKNNEAIIISL